MDTRLQSTIKIVKISGKKVLEIYHKQVVAYEKEDKSPVTEADLESEKIILSGLDHFGYGFLAEETKDDLLRLKQEKIWIIDPLDGTVDFLKKTGEFSIMIALVEKNEAVFGVVYGPVLDKLYFAEKGKGAFLKEKGKPLKKLAVSKIKNLVDAEFVVSRHHLIGTEKKFLERNRSKTRNMGSIGLKLGLIAEGKAEAYINFSDKTAQWDIAAPEIILSEAGGVVSDMNGGNFIYNRRETKNLNGIVAGNRPNHNKILEGIKNL